jgi:hypothetical protein
MSVPHHPTQSLRLVPAEPLRERDEEYERLLRMEKWQNEKVALSLKGRM